MQVFRGFLKKAENEDWDFKCTCLYAGGGALVKIHKITM